VLRLREDFDRPRTEIHDGKLRMTFMGQFLNNPPSVEGWHEGPEWIDTGTLVERINFASEQLGAAETPGSHSLIRRVLADNGGTVTPERLVDLCLDHLGAISVEGDTRSKLIGYAAQGGDLHVRGPELDETARQRVSDIVQLAAATPEFQRS